MAFTTRLPEDLETWLEQYCQAQGAAKSRVVELALREYLRVQDPQPVHAFVFSPVEGE